MGPEATLAIILVAIPAIASVIVSVLNRRKLEELTLTVDGRLTQLLEVTATSQHAEGMVAGAVDSAAIEQMISHAISQALAAPPPPGLKDIQATGIDTNRRVRAVQDTEADVAAALAAKERAQADDAAKNR